jgi:hypothetical protein
MNDTTVIGSARIYYPPGPPPYTSSILLSTCWNISSISTNGTFNASSRSNFQTINTIMSNCQTSTTYVSSAFVGDLFTDSLVDTKILVLETDVEIYFGSTTIVNSGGRLSSFDSIYAKTGYAETLSTNRVLAPGTSLYFGSSLSSISLVACSTVDAASIGVNNLYTRSANFGEPLLYSTFAPSSIWLQATDSNTPSYTPLTTEPFHIRKGLGTYFDPASFVSYTNGATVFTPVDPTNTRSTTAGTIQGIQRIAGTGVQGMPSTTGYPALSSQIGVVTGTPAYDTSGSLFFFTSSSGVSVPAANRGIRLCSLGSNGFLSSLGGAYQYYQGNGGQATQTAFGTALGIAAYQSTTLISDRNNYEVRYVSTNGVVYPFAGNTLAGYSGDGGPATSAKLGSPYNTAFDSTGSNVYIADPDNFVVRMVNLASGQITTVAGTGVSGYSGDGGPAVFAQLRSPRGVTVDLSGNLYIADTGDHRVRKVQAVSGVITTYAGTGVPGYSGDLTLATLSQLSSPTQVSMTDSGDLYIADTGNHRVRKVANPSLFILTIAGTGVPGNTGEGPATTSRLSTPTSVAAFSQGTLEPRTTLYGNTTRLVPNSLYSLISSNSNTQFPNPSTIVATGGTGTYSYNAYTSIAYERECTASFIPVYTQSEFVAGIGTQPYLYTGNLSGNELGFLCSTNGSAYVMRYSTVVSSAGAWNSTTVLRVDFTGNTLIAYKNNVALYSTPRVVDEIQTLYFNANFKQTAGQTATIRDIQFSGADLSTPDPIAATNVPALLGEAVDVPEHTTINAGVFYSTITANPSPQPIGSLFYRYTPLSTLNQQFSVMGSSGSPTLCSILYSYDGVNWLPSPNATSLLSNCAAVAWNGSLWVAGGTRTGTTSLLYSSDGITWSASPSDLFSVGCTGVAWNGFRWIASGSGGNSLLISADGITWTPTTNGSTILSSADTITWFAANSLWIAGGNGLIATSSNGNVWGLQSSATGVLNTVTGQVACSDSMSIIVGDGASMNVLYSLDGFDWDPLPAASSFFDAAYTVAWNGTKWLIGGVKYSVGAVIIYSYDGYTWYSAESAITAFPVGYPGPNSISWNGVRWIISISGVSVELVNGYSRDGIQWIGHTCAKAILTAGGGSAGRAVLPLLTNPTVQYNPGIWSLNLYAAYISNILPTGGNAYLYLDIYKNGTLIYNGFQPVLIPSAGLVPVYASAFPVTLQALTVSAMILETSDTLEFRLSAKSTNPEGGVLRIYTNFTSAIDYPSTSPVTTYQSVLTTPYTGPGTEATIYIADRDNNIVHVVNEKANSMNNLAGTGVSGTSGDGGLATAATLTSPNSVAVDPLLSTVYIADASAKIRSVNTSTGIIQTYAGNGSPAYTADGLPPISTLFGDARATSFDQTGALYYADPDTYVIRKWNRATNTITTIAGTPGVSGSSGDGGLATAARIGTVYSLAVNKSTNTLYFGEYDMYRVRRIDLTTGIITTVIGTGVAGYTGDGGLATAARINAPLAIAVNSQEDLYVSDPVACVIRKVSIFTKIITTVVGTGTAGFSGNGGPASFAQIGVVPSMIPDSINNIVFSDTNNNQIRKYTFAIGTVTAYAGSGSGTASGDGSAALLAGIPSPSGLAFDLSWNTLTVTDQNTYTIRRTTPPGLSNAPVQYLNFKGLYTNYATTSPGYMSLAINGTPVYENTTAVSVPMTLTDVYMAQYPFTKVNPTTSDFTPFVELVHYSGNVGKQKTTANLWMTQTPGQGTTSSIANSNAGIMVNSYAMVWPSTSLNAITIQNPYGDTQCRSVFYTGARTQVSDPELKEEITLANTRLCYSTLDALPLRRYAYIPSYLSTFQLSDAHRLGFLTTEVSPHFPNAVREREFPVEESWAPSTIQMLDDSQIRYAHLGATKELMERVKFLRQQLKALKEAEIAT